MSDAPETMVTLVTNQFSDISRIRSLIRSFAAMMDDWGLGSTWSTEGRASRLDGIFFVEHVDTNIHAHGLVRFPYGDTLSRQLRATEVWAKICPSGSIQVTPIDWAVGAIFYCTKEMALQRFQQDQIVLLSEFMSPTSLSKPTN